jgi:hypothetical protein
MSLKSKLYRVALAMCLVVSMSVLTFADTIRLKDGSIIKGKIVNFGDGKFTVLIGEGSRQRQMSFFADEVESIEFDNSSIPVSTGKTTLPTYTDTSAKKDSGNNTVITVPKTTNTDSVTTSPTNPTKVITTDNTNSSNNSTGSNQTSPNTTPTPVQPNTSSNPTNPNTSKTTTQPKPITLSVKVLADNTANGWTNSGWVVRKGQKIKITGAGRVSLGNGRFSTPAGVNSLPDKDKLLQTEATGGLIAVIGDDNNDFIFIGGSREFVATRDGSLFLGVNEGNLNDNSGSFDATVEITP